MNLHVSNDDETNSESARLVSPLSPLLYFTLLYCALQTERHDSLLGIHQGGADEHIAEARCFLGSYPDGTHSKHGN